MGATERVDEAHGAVSVVVLRPPGASAASLSYALVDRTAILATGARSGRGRGAAALAPAVVASRRPRAWATARRALGDAPSVVRWAPAGPRSSRGCGRRRTGSPSGSRARPASSTRAALLGAREPSFRALAADGKAAGAVARLAPEAQLAARWDGDFAALGAKLVPALPAAERARRARARRGPRARRLAVPAPGGAVAGVARAGARPLGAHPGRGARRPPPGVPVRGGAPREGPRRRGRRPRRARGRVDARRERRGRPRRPPTAFTGSDPVRRDPGAWTRDALDRRGGRTAGAARALQARLAAEDGFRAPAKAADAALAGGLGGAVLVPPRVVAAVRAMPEEAFGAAPPGS
ncbi:MAG: hypothetical protein MZU95_05260 [Desulfomicrobium escambiense]|nr:hypothetical protein [Desulfomicrobium escambiense]